MPATFFLSYITLLGFILFFCLTVTRHLGSGHLNLISTHP